MRHSTAVLIGNKDWYCAIGKETSDTSFRIGALKKDERIVTVLAPSRFPEKIRSLLFPLSLTDTVFIDIDRIDRILGEVLISLDLAGMKKGFLHVSDNVDGTMLESLIRGTVVEHYIPMDPDPAVLREKLLDLDNTWPEGPTRVVVDQSFHVKGVGTVVLGFVISGTVRKHQELLSLPAGKGTTVRSIQIHDRDHADAPAGARVGLALKNISPEVLPRGSLLTEEGGASTTSVLDLDLRISGHWKEPLDVGKRIHLWSSLQFVPAEVVEVNFGGKDNTGYVRSRVRVETESSVWAHKGQKFGLVHLDSPKFRFFAAGETI